MRAAARAEAAVDADADDDDEDEGPSLPRPFMISEGRMAKLKEEKRSDNRCNNEELGMNR